VNFVLILIANQMGGSIVLDRFVRPTNLSKARTRVPKRRGLSNGTVTRVARIPPLTQTSEPEFMK